jgi:hypothetical protein
VLVKAEGAKQVKIEGGVRAYAPQSTIKSEPGLANEDSVAVPASAAASTQAELPAAANNPRLADGDLERKIAKAKRLAEEIEREERLARLKREQDALEEEIEAARARRAQS